MPGTEGCYTLAAEDTFKTVDLTLRSNVYDFAPPGNFTGRVLRNYVSFCHGISFLAAFDTEYRDNEPILDTLMPLSLLTKI